MIFMTSLSLEQAESLAPDSGTLNRARKIAKRSKYQNVGISERAIWGVAQGSSQYDSFVDLQGPAFKCSCPVNKLPCKHIMGLMLLVASDPDAATSDTMPDGLTAWLDKRDSTAQGKATKAANKGTGEVKDKAAQERRVQAREANVQQGIDELERFLEDIVSTGLIEASKRTDDLWEQIRRRLMDAQARGLASQLEAIRLMMGQGPNWTDKVLLEIAWLYNLIRGYRSREHLPAGLVDELRMRIGWNKSKEELAVSPKVEGQWLILNLNLTYERELYTQTIWMMHTGTGQLAQVLNFATPFNPEAIQRGLVAGTLIQGQATYYSQWSPRRVAFVRTHALQQDNAEEFDWMANYAHVNIRKAVSTLQQGRIRQPLPAQWPLLLQDVRLVMKDQRLALADAQGCLLLIDETQAKSWELLAAMGDQTATVFVTTTDGQQVTPWACLQQGRWIALDLDQEDVE